MELRTLKSILWVFMFVLGWTSSGLAQQSPQRPVQGGQTVNRGGQDVLYLTPEQERETLTYLKEVRPEQGERLLMVRDRRPQQYRIFLSRAYREMRYMSEIRKSDPDRYERLRREKQMESETQDLAARYKSTEDESEKSRIRAELMELLGSLFDMRQLNREDEIIRLEKRLEELREAQVDRQSHKEEIVLRRLQELIDDKAWEW